MQVGRILLNSSFSDSPRLHAYFLASYSYCCLFASTLFVIYMTKRLRRLNTRVSVLGPLGSYLPLYANRKPIWDRRLGRPVVERGD